MKILLGVAALAAALGACSSDDEKHAHSIEVSSQCGGAEEDVELLGVRELHAYANEWWYRTETGNHRVWVEEHVTVWCDLDDPIPTNLEIPGE